MDTYVLTLLMPNIFIYSTKLCVCLFFFHFFRSFRTFLAIATICSHKADDLGVVPLFGLFDAQKRTKENQNFMQHTAESAAVVEIETMIQKEMEIGQSSWFISIKIVK